MDSCGQDVDSFIIELAGSFIDTLDANLSAVAPISGFGRVGIFGKTGKWWG